MAAEHKELKLGDSVEQYIKSRYPSGNVAQILTWGGDDDDDDTPEFVVIVGLPRRFGRSIFAAEIIKRVMTNKDDEITIVAAGGERILRGLKTRMSDHGITNKIHYRGTAMTAPITKLTIFIDAGWMPSWPKANASGSSRILIIA